MIKNISLVIISLCLFAVQFNAQTEEQIKRQLEIQGIRTTVDIQKALQSRNLTEEDARKLAKQYGLNYDQFLSLYILGEREVLGTQPSIKTFFPDTSVSEKFSEMDRDSLAEVGKHKSKPSDTNDSTNRYFGYKLFEDIPSAFEPAAVGPIDPGYLIGPGDVLRLYLWGAVELQYELNVDNQGTVFIPTAGQMFVSGVPYSELKNKMTLYLSRFYEGLTTNPPTVFLDISLAKLKPIKIFVMGEVAKPGGYSVSSYATVFNALYSVGGPLTSGSLREIRVIRNNKVITKVDLYDYLLKGQLIGDVRLQNNDMVFVQPRGKTVTIDGEVLRSAIYELRENENLRKLIEFAGGIKSTAYTGRIQISRVKPFDQRKKFEYEKEILDVDLSEILRNPSADFTLFDGDTITVFPISKKLINYVVIQGAVLRPGTYQYSQGKRISDLVNEAEGVLPEAYLGKADIFRTRPDETYQYVSVDLAKALDGDIFNNIQLKPRDSVKIYSIYDLIEKREVSVLGYVKNPVTLPYADSLTLYDMVFRAGGLQDPIFRGKAFILRGDIIRINPDGLTTRIIPFNLEQLLRERTVNINLEPGDKIIIYKADVEKVIDKYVRIEGEVRRPGKFPLSTNMTPMDLILQAGGFTEKSLRTEVYVNRVRPSGYEGEQISESFVIPLAPTFEKKVINDQSEIDTIGLRSDKFILQHKDIVVVRKNPSYEDQRIVYLSGEVNRPGTYVLENKNESLYDLIIKAGGPTSEAFLFGTQYEREGRKLVVDLEALYYDKDMDENVFLKNGDRIFIPKKPNTVIVDGEVNNPGLYRFIEGLSVKDYIENAGGVTDSANYVIYRKANGESRRVNFGLFTSNPEVYDGSVLIVTKEPPPPPRETSFDLGKTVIDIFALLASAATVWVLSKQL